MKVECENCHDVVEVTAKTVVAPFVCSVCVNDATPTPVADANDMVDGESLPEHDACDTATVENTTLLIEDLQQQLADERASIIALEAENAKLKQDSVERMTQIQNQADTIKEQEGHIDQDLRAIFLLMGERTSLAKQLHNAELVGVKLGEEFAKSLFQFSAQADELKKFQATVKLLDERNLRQYRSIALYQEQEVKLQGQVTFWKAMTEKWTRRAEGARDLAIARKGIITDLKRHPIREYFRNAWSR